MTDGGLWIVPGVGWTGWGAPGRRLAYPVPYLSSQGCCLLASYAAYAAYAARASFPLQGPRAACLPCPGRLPPEDKDLSNQSQAKSGLVRALSF